MNILWVQINISQNFYDGDFYRHFNGLVKKTCMKIRSKKKTYLELQCFYCDDLCNLKELTNLDKNIETIDPEDLEQIYDNLPQSANPRKKPFTHKSDLGYEVLNICPVCWKKAQKNESN